MGARGLQWPKLAAEQQNATRLRRARPKPHVSSVPSIIVLINNTTIRRITLPMTVKVVSTTVPKNRVLGREKVSTRVVFIEESDSLLSCGSLVRIQPGSPNKINHLAGVHR